MEEDAPDLAPLVPEVEAVGKPRFGRRPTKIGGKGGAGDARRCGRCGVTFRGRTYATLCFLGILARNSRAYSA